MWSWFTIFTKTTDEPEPIKPLIPIIPKATENPFKAAFTIIKEFEGCKLQAYKDIKGIWTIGYGSTQHVLPGMSISQENADERLKSHIFETYSEIKTLVKMPMTHNQLNAIISLVYNIGIGRFRQSSLLAKLNGVHSAGLTADEFLKWDKMEGLEIPGLLRRRLAERELFLS